MSGFAALTRLAGGAGTAGEAVVTLRPINCSSVDSLFSRQSRIALHARLPRLSWVARFAQFASVTLLRFSWDAGFACFYKRK